MKIYVLVALFLASAGVLLFLNYEDNKSAQEFSNLSDIVSFAESSGESAGDAGGASEGAVSFGDLASGDDVGSTSGSAGSAITQQSFAELKALNVDFAGWLSVAGTTVNYPVMQRACDEAYYLHRDFYGNFSSYGVPFIDERYERGVSQNLVIYGHAMDNDTMFSQLENFRSESFYKQNSLIGYSDESGYLGFEVFGAFEINVEADDFRYHNYVNLDESLYNEFVQNVKSRSFYETGKNPQFGDLMVTLSTCVNDKTNVRLVVVGFIEG